VSLSGNLGFVSLDEVLRLLTRSKQRGAVDIKGEKVHGRVFVDRGAVGLATTFTDEALRRHLIKSGLVEAAQLDSVIEGRSNLAKVTESDGGAMTDLLREMSVESIYQLGLQGETFEVYENQTSPYTSPKPFDLEDLLGDAKQRLNDWAEVTKMVSDLERHLRFRRDLGEREQVTIAKDAWRVLSEVGQGSSVRALADELGTTEFWAARVAARLIEENLLTLDAPPMVTETVAPSWEYQAPVVEETADEEPVLHEEPAVEEEPIFATEAAIEEQHGEAAEVDDTLADSAEVDPNQSWWKEPDPEPVEDADLEGVAAASDTMVETATLPDVEEDTEAFLEKVFSDMEPTEETDEGYGLLRRRRMGVLRDLSNDA
jgi:Domain of unknown function (DUF4388)